MNVLPVVALSVSSDQHPSSDKHGLLRAAREFEALLIAQILKSASESCLGSGLGAAEEDQAGAQALSIAQEQFASALSMNGGLGLAEMVTRAVKDHGLPAS
jgi:Rod binding domain-containing protein